MNISKKYIVGGLATTAIIGLGFYFFSGQKKSPEPDTTTIKRGSVIQEVDVTGRVKSTNSADLGFEKSGRVENVYARVGERVESGKILAEVDSSSARGALLEAEARLSELKRGPRPEEIVVKKAEIAKYTQDLDNAYASATDISNDAFAKADDALHAKVSGIFSGYKTSSYKYTFSVCNSQLAVDGELLRYSAEIDFDKWREENDSRLALDRAGKHLEEILSFLNSVGRTLSLDCTISNTALDTYRTNINTARTNITTSLANVNAKKQSIATLALSLAKVKDELSLLEAGAASEVIAAQEARILSSRGELSKYSLVSPISGIVTKVDIKEGEGSTVGKTVFSIISDTSFEIEAYVPEADIAKIKIGNHSQVTLDAYGEDVPFDATIFKIDPAETVIDNVPTYKTTLRFTKNDTRIKSGMTANIEISASSRENVLFAPERSIITRGNEKFLRVVDSDNSTTDTPVTVGLKGSDGSREIVSGISEGLNIVTSPKD